MKNNLFSVLRFLEKTALLSLALLLVPVGTIAARDDGRASGRGRQGHGVGTNNNAPVLPRPTNANRAPTVSVRMNLIEYYCWIRRNPGADNPWTNLRLGVIYRILMVRDPAQRQNLEARFWEIHAIYATSPGDARSLLGHFGPEIRQAHNQPWTITLPDCFCTNGRRGGGR